jgi:hypothetical protein
VSKEAQINVWREDVDDATVAIIAIVEFVFRGGYHMASAWAIAARSDYRWREVGKTALREHVIKEHGGHVPYIRRARDDHAAAPVFRDGRRSILPRADD